MGATPHIDNLTGDGSATEIKASRYRLIFPVLAAMATGLLLWIAYPPVDSNDMVWFALVPFILLARHVKPRAAFKWGWLAGMLFWVLSLTWLWRLIGNGGPWPLVILGQTALAAYCALFFGLYALAASAVWQRINKKPNSRWRLLAVVIMEPLLWAGSEYLRGVLFGGFPWNTLAVAQSQNAAMLQPAAWGGVALVSAVLFGFNSGVASLLERVFQPLFKKGTKGGGFNLWRSAEGVLPLLILVACWMGGMQRVQNIKRTQRNWPEWRVVLVQPLTPSIFMVTDEIIETQRKVLLEQTTFAAATGPDLVIWPETAVQGVMPWHAEVMTLASNAATVAGAPLLTGTIEAERAVTVKDPHASRFYNAAWLFSAQGVQANRYRKQHLVPFGEFIPGDRWLPVLERLSPVGFSCAAGRESTIMEIRRRNGAGDETLPFSPLICFEDLFAELGRKAVKRGAKMLVNITNDAWFDGSSENELHFRQAVLRAIENGVPLVRVANTGITGIIYPNGLTNRFMEGSKQAAGFMTLSVPIPEGELLPTPYQRYGDWGFGLPAGILALAWGLVGWRKNNAKA